MVIYHCHKRSTRIKNTIDDILVFKEGCPMCRTPLRRTEPMYSKVIEEIIQTVIKHTDEVTQKAYKLRSDDANAREETLKVKDAKEGMSVDVRDTEYIWCRGIVKEVLPNKHHHTNTLLIHYERWSKIYDEYICQNSCRISPVGTYTSRSEIPHYEFSHAREDILSDDPFTLPFLSFTNPTGAGTSVNNNETASNSGFDELERGLNDIASSPGDASFRNLINRNTANPRSFFTSAFESFELLTNLLRSLHGRPLLLLRPNGDGSTQTSSQGANPSQNTTNYPPQPGNPGDS